MNNERDGITLLAGVRPSLLLFIGKTWITDVIMNFVFTFLIVLLIITLYYDVFKKRSLPEDSIFGIINLEYHQTEDAVLKLIGGQMSQKKIYAKQMEFGGTPVMKLKNILIVVKDIEKSKQFYHDLFGLDMVLDQDGNMILTEGLVLQDEKIWREFLGKETVPEHNCCELYFEERNIEAFVEKLEEMYPSIQYVNRLMTHSWGQKVVRFYDLDGNLIEVGTPV